MIIHPKWEEASLRLHYGGFPVQTAGLQRQVLGYAPMRPVKPHPRPALAVRRRPRPSIPLRPAVAEWALKGHTRSKDPARLRYTWRIARPIAHSSQSILLQARQRTEQRLAVDYRTRMELAPSKSMLKTLGGAVKLTPLAASGRGFRQVKIAIPAEAREEASRLLDRLQILDSLPPHDARTSA